LLQGHALDRSKLVALFAESRPFDACSLALPSSAATGLGGEKSDLSGLVTHVASTFY
jgi:hypothetical protein